MSASTSTFVSISNTHRFSVRRPLCALPLVALVCLNKASDVLEGAIPMYRIRLIALVCLSVLAFSLEAHGGLITQTPVGLLPGQWFRFVFLTSGTTNAQSTDIGTYDNWVQGLADNAAMGTYDGTAVTWKAIGSTATVDANASDRLPSEEIPIYRLDGQLVVAASGDIWGGSISNPINLTEQLVTDTGTLIVWTGTNSNGTKANEAYLGRGETAWIQSGNPQALDGKWVANFEHNSASDTLPMYAFSSPIQAVPEPGTVALVLVVGAALFGMHRAKRRWQLEQAAA